MKLFIGLIIFLGMLSPSHAITTDVTVAWSSVDHAQRYKLLEKKPGETSFTQVYLNSATKAELGPRDKGIYTYQLYSCIDKPLVNEEVQILCEEISEVTEKTVDIGKNLERRVIFIHTDLLGSPAAETDEAGEVK